MSILAEKTFAFALAVIPLCDELTKKQEFVFSRQLLRSATSIGANVEEALCGQSRKDFLAKIYIAYKEAREANYWLRLLTVSGKISKEKLKQPDILLTEIRKIISATIRTTKEKI